MSYILDALRKSDEQRRRGATPTLLTPQAATLAPPRRKSMSYWMLGGALLVAGVLIGSLQPWKSARHAPAPASAPLAAPPASTPSSAPVVAAAPADGVQQPAAPVQKPPPASRAAVAPAPVAKPVEKTEAGAEVEAVVKARPSRSSRETVAPAPKSPAKSPAGGTADSRPGKAPPEQPIVRFSDLPVEVQVEIPKLQITVHAYSPVPKERLVGINDLLLREGGSVSPDLKLEQITPDGMVMTYKGYRFRRGVR